MHNNFLIMVLIFFTLTKKTLQECVLLTKSDPYSETTNKYINCYNETLSSDFSDRLSNHLDLKILYNGIKWLEFSNTESSEIASDAFKNLNFLNDIRINGAGVNLIQIRAFSALSNLKVLSLKNNKLTQIKADFFRNLGKLQKIDVSFNSIVSVSADSFLAQKYILKSLVLKNNLITQLLPGVFNGLGQLEILDLSFNMLSTIDTNLLKYLAKLRILRLDNNRFIQFDSILISNNHLLTDLYLNNNNIIIINNFWFKNPLNILNISHNTIQFMIFSKFSQVDTFDLSCNNFTSKQNLVLHNLAVKNININENFLGDNSTEELFSNISNVTSLSLANNQIKNLDFSPKFKIFNQLKHLDLSKNFLSFENTTLTFPDSITTLNLNENKFDSNLNLSKLENLKLLTISLNSLTEITYNFLKDLTKLTILNLSKNKISKLALGSFRDLKSLQSLDLSFNNINNLELGTFTGLVVLDEIDLSNNKLTNVGNDVFHNLIALRFLNLNYNNISFSSIDNTLNYLVQLKEIALTGNGWSCNQLTSLLKKEKRIKITNGGNHEETNVEGVKCKNEASASTNLFNLEQETAEDITSKLTKNITALIIIIVIINIVLIILVIIVLLCVLKYGKKSNLKQHSSQELHSFVRI